MTFQQFACEFLVVFTALLVWGRLDRGITWLIDRARQPRCEICRKRPVYGATFSIMGGEKRVAVMCKEHFDESVEWHEKERERRMREQDGESWKG